jgi:hypothetical protein
MPLLYAATIVTVKVIFEVEGNPKFAEDFLALDMNGEFT